MLRMALDVVTLLPRASQCIRKQPFNNHCQNARTSGGKIPQGSRRAQATHSGLWQRGDRFYARLKAEDAPLRCPAHEAIELLYLLPSRRFAYWPWVQHSVRHLPVISPKKAHRVNVGSDSGYRRTGKEKCVREIVIGWSFRENARRELMMIAVAQGKPGFELRLQWDYNMIRDYMSRVGRMVKD